MRANLVSMLGLVALVGCSPNSGNSAGGASGTGSSSSTGGTSAGGNAGSAQSNGGASGAGTDQGGGGAGQPATGGSAMTSKRGQVLVQSRTRTGSTVSVSASFVSDPGTSTAECTWVQDGPCSASTCTPTANPSQPIYASAGTVTVTSPEVMGTATLIPEAEGTYPQSNQMFFEKVFDGGEHLQVKASGAMVPAFEGEVDVPLVLLLSQPPFAPPQTSVDVPRAQDLSLVWTRGVKDVFLYVLGSSQRADGQPGSAGISCQFPSEAGSGVIKSSFLQPMKAETQLNLFTVGAKLITAGEYSVTLGVTMPATNPDKVNLPNFTLK